MYVWSKLSAARWADAWEERFHGPLRTALAITSLPGGKSVRVEVYCSRRAEAERIAREFGGTVRELKNRNWAAAATSGLQPVRIRNRLVIVHDEAARQAAQETFPGRIILTIPGDMAFGTGDHATTSTCLRLLVDYAGSAEKPWRMLDVGSGTGILAIAGAKLGAAAEGFDYDPAAVRIANRNARLNSAAGVRFHRADLLQWKPGREKYDLVAANVFYDVLTVSFPAFARAVRPGGWLMVSGILKEQAPGCLSAATAAGFRTLRTVRRGKWVTALLQLPDPGASRTKPRRRA